MMNVEVRNFPNHIVSEEEDRASDGSDNEGIGGGGGGPIRKPGPHDVLLGRGGGTNNHSGNVKFRQLVKEHKMRYLACSKVEKPKVARDVVELWRKLDPPGRFLTRQESPLNKTGPGSVKDANNIWTEVSDKKAREKASQCLRERTEDVIPYLSQLRKQQDEMTEKGVTQVQRKLQMGNDTEKDKSEVYTSQSMAKETTPKKSVLSNTPDRPSSSSIKIAPSPDRRMSMPVVSSSRTVPISPAAANAGHGGGVSRRTSLPPVNQMQADQMKMNMQILAHQQEMMHKQQVLRDAYTAIERSNGMQMMQQNMMTMQQAMGQQHMLAERQAMMQQQYANFGDAGGGPMSPMARVGNGGMTPQEQRMMMMQQQQQQQQHNSMMAQQQQAAMARTGGMHHGMMSHHHQQQQEMEMNMAMMANSNNNSNNMNQMANINTGMHNMHMNNNMNVMSNQVHQQQMQRPIQQQHQQQRMVGHVSGGMPNMNPPLMNDPQSPRLMHAGHNHLNQDNSPKFGGGNPNNMTGNVGVHPPPQQHRPRNVDAPLSTVDFEPLPAYETAGRNGQSPGGRQGPGALPDEAKSSAPPRFISPNIVDPNNEKKQDSQVDSKSQQEDRHEKDMSNSAASSNCKASSTLSKTAGGESSSAAAAKGGDDLSNAHDGHKVGNGKDGRGGKRRSLSPPGDDDDNKCKGSHETALKEYRKTLESYIENHQISTPAVDIDDDASDDDEDGANGPGFEGIDASEWIQQALNDSADMSLNDRSKHLANARRALLKDSRDNSKKSLMSTGTGMTGFTGGHDSMSIALSDMEECSLPLKDEGAGDAPRRGSFSNRSISSELTDFSELDGL